MAANNRVVFERAKGRFFAEHQCPQLALEAPGVPGMAVAVVLGDETPVLRGYGVREILKKGEARKEVNEDTVFQLASVSKPITSTVIATLVGDGVKRGVIDWDDPVSDHDPTFALSNPDSTRAVTVADLLAHCSGLPAHAGDMLEDIGYDRDTVLYRLRHLPAAPRMTKARYTNFGFTAAAVAAARACSTPWEDLAREKLYDPLGMKRTSSRYADFCEGDTFVYQTFGENAVGPSAVEFHISESGKALSVKNLPFSKTAPDYSEIVPDYPTSDPSKAKEAVFIASEP